MQEQELPKENTAVILPRCSWGERDPNLPEQTQFSPETKNIMLIKARGGFINGELLAFFKRMLEVEQPQGERIGLLFLINDNKTDRNRDELVDEHQQLMHYLTAIQYGDLAALASMAIPPGYLEIAKKTIERIDLGALELRFDILHNCPHRHFGQFDLHLIRLINSLRATQLSTEQIICHFMDLDTVFLPDHLIELSKFYKDKASQHHANVASWDLLPEMAENEIQSKEMLMTTDAFRLLWYVLQVDGFIIGILRSEGSTISARLSALDEPEIRLTLEHSKSDDDYRLGTYLQQTTPNNIGFVGQVYNVDHARPIQDGIIASNTEIRFTAILDEKARTVVGFQPFFDGCRRYAAQLYPPREARKLWAIKRQLYDSRSASFTAVSNEEILTVNKALIQDLGELSYYYRSLPPEIQTRICEMLIPEIINYVDHRRSRSLDEEDDFYQFSMQIWLFISKEVREIVPGAVVEFMIPEKFDGFIAHSVRAIRLHGRSGQMSLANFSFDDADFQSLYTGELTLEKAKVKDRKRKLRQALEVALKLVDADGIPDRVMATIGPYLQHFQTEINQAIFKARLLQIRNQIISVFLPTQSKVGLVENVTQIITDQFPEFFNPDDKIHTDIATARTLFAWLRAKNVTMV